MSKKLTFTTLLFSLFMLSGCGKDGSPGVAAISIDWDWYVDGYNDNNPSIPNAISRNFNYSTNPGKYSCEYACSDGNGSFWFWEYEYTISINKGDEGKLFRSGENGKNRNHKMFLNGLSKPSFSVSELSVNKAEKKELKPFTINTVDFKKVYQSDPIIDQYSADGYTIITERRQFTLE